jgi:hypothetical protein
MRGGLLIFSLLLLNVFISCRKNPPKDTLPANTYSGEHTLGFLANGESWLPYDRGSHEAFELPKAELGDNGELKISATRIDDEHSCRNWFCIEIEEGCDKEGIYQVSNHICTSPYQTFYYNRKGNLSAENFEIDTSKPHYIEVVYLDRKNKIIAGKFEFDLISTDQDAIQIRSGRFDLIYE